MEKVHPNPDKGKDRNFGRFPLAVAALIVLLAATSCQIEVQNNSSSPDFKSTRQCDEQIFSQAANRIQVEGTTENVVNQLHRWLVRDGMVTCEDFDVEPDTIVNNWNRMITKIVVGNGSILSTWDDISGVIYLTPGGDMETKMDHEAGHGTLGGIREDSGFSLIHDITEGTATTIADLATKRKIKPNEYVMSCFNKRFDYSEADNATRRLLASEYNVIKAMAESVKFQSGRWASRLGDVASKITAWRGKGESVNQVSEVIWNAYAPMCMPK